VDDVCGTISCCEALPLPHVMACFDAGAHVRAEDILTVPLPEKETVIFLSLSLLSLYPSLYPF
jgi:hypothetical protein